MPCRTAAVFSSLLLACLLIAGGMWAPGISAQSSGCDQPRAALATMTDAGAADVSLRPLDQQVVDLDNWPRPAYLPPDLRAGGIESHVYAVTAELMAASQQSNGDITLVLAQPGDRRWTIAGVIPNAGSCASGSVAAASIQTAGSNLSSAVGLPFDSGIQAAPAIVRVVGAGFFIPGLPRQGDAPNGLELSPVIDFSLAGPAALPAFPILPPAGRSAPVAATARQSMRSPPTQAAAVAPAEGATPSLSETVAPATPAASPIDAPAQEIVNVLTSAAPSGTELPPGIGTLLLLSSGPASSPAGNEYDLNYLALSGSGQPAGALVYAVFDTGLAANNGFNLFQSLAADQGISVTQPVGLLYPTACTQPQDATAPASCVMQIGSVVVSAQASGTASALALAQAGAGHLLRLAGSG